MSQNDVPLEDSREQIDQLSVHMMHNEAVLRDRADEVLVQAWRTYHATKEYGQDYQEVGTYISSLVALSHEFMLRADLEERIRMRRGE